jgi:hypothetical protein
VPDLIGLCYANHWLGPLSVFPQKRAEFHLVNFSVLDGRGGTRTDARLMRVGASKSLANRIDIDDFEK